MSRDRDFAPDFVVAPGETLREIMESQGLTQREMAGRLGVQP